MDLSSRTISLRTSSPQQTANAKAGKRFSSTKKSVSKVIVQPSAQKTVLLRRIGAARPETIDFESVGKEVKKSDTLVWIDVRDPSNAELADLSKEFDFNPLSLEDALKQRQRPKVDEYPNYYFIVMYAPLESTDEELHMTEIDIFVGENYVVSLHPGHVPALDLARKRWEKATPELGDRVGFLAHVVVDAIIDACFPIVDDIDDRLHRLDNLMFHSNRGANAEELLMLKRSVFALRTSLYPLREAFNSFPKHENSLFDLATHPYFQDVYDHILRLLDIIEIQQEMVTGAADAHLAFMSNQLNETMKTLTVVGICEAAAAAVFGAWGMNVAGVPFAHVNIGGVEMGFWVVSALTMGLIGIALLWLRRRGMW